MGTPYKDDDAVDGLDFLQDRDNLDMQESVSDILKKFKED